MVHTSPISHWSLAHVIWQMRIALWLQTCELWHEYNNIVLFHVCWNDNTFTFADTTLITVPLLVKTINHFMEKPRIQISNCEVWIYYIEFEIRIQNITVCIKILWNTIGNRDTLCNLQTPQIWIMDTGYRIIINVPITRTDYIILCNQYLRK